MNIKRFGLIPSILLISLFLSSCGDSDWGYPIKLGDSREKVVSILGSGILKGKNSLDPNGFYTYPNSGVSITYNDFDRVEKIRFVGNYYQETWIRYEGKIIFGIDLDMKLNDLNKILGDPVKVIPSPFVQESNDYFWKKDGILIECEIWTEDLDGYWWGGKVEKDTIRSLKLKTGI